MGRRGRGAGSGSPAMRVPGLGLSPGRGAAVPPPHPGLSPPAAGPPSWGSLAGSVLLWNSPARISLVQGELSVAGPSR